MEPNENETLNTTEESSTLVKDANPEASSPTENQPEEGAKTIADVVNEVIAKPEHSPSSDEKEKEESPVLKSDETEQKKADGKEDPEAKKQEELPPFHEHPAWKRVTGERDELKTKVEEVETWRKENEPIVQAHKSLADFCMDNNISPEEMNQTLQGLAQAKAEGITQQEVQQAVTFLKQIKTDPSAALATLKPVWDGLQIYRGEVIPPELQAEVDRGILTAERAKELVQLRAQTTFKEKRREIEAQQREEQTRKQFVNETYRSLTGWEQQRREKDPDFVPKSKVEDEDGKYEWFVAKFKTMLDVTPPKTTQDVVAMAERAYTSVDKAMSKILAPSKRNGHKVLPTSRSSSNPVKEPETVRDVVRMVAARHGQSMD